MVTDIRTAGLNILRHRDVRLFKFIAAAAAIFLLRRVGGDGIRQAAQAAPPPHRRRLPHPYSLTSISIWRG